MVVKPDLDSLVIELEKWLKTQPHLPQEIETIVLKRFLYSTYGDLDGAKRLLELNYAMRNKNPHIFLQRDPMDESSQRLLQVADLVPLPGLTPEKNKLLLYRLIDYDPDKFNFTDSIRVFFMMADCRFSIIDEAGMCDGEIPIFDMAGYSLRHLTKTVFNSLRIYMKFVQEAFPVRLKQIHVLNCPSYLDKVMTVVKPFIKSEVLKLIHFHLPGADTNKYFPTEMLPKDYGGQGGEMKDLKDQWMKHLKEKRDYLMDQNRWKVDKNKKLDTVNTVNQNFKTLEID